MTPITSYLKDGVLPDGKDAVRKLKVQTAWFVLIKGILYKRGFSHPYLRCLIPEEADYVMREVHKGACGNHSGTRSLVHKLIWAWYYWPTAKGWHCICQRLQQMLEVWQPHLAADWGTHSNDGPMAIHSVGTGHHGSIPDSISTAQICSSRYRLLHKVGRSRNPCRYSIPRVLISDNGKQFDNNAFRDFAHR